MSPHAILDQDDKTQSTPITAAQTIGAEVDDKSLLVNVEEFSKAAAEHKVQDRFLSLPQFRPSSILRIPSPDTLSELSVDDNGLVRPGRGSFALQPLGRILSNTPAEKQGPRTRLREFWVRNKGLGLVLLAQIFGTLMNVTTRLLELEGNNGKGLHPFQILFVRMSITVVLASAYMWRKRTPDFPFGAREVRPLLVARGLGGFFGVFGMYYSLMYLPLADATVITFLAPSLACWACSYLIKEPFTRIEQIAAYISLFGVVLIARPASLFSSSTGTSAPPASGSADPAALSNATAPVVASEAFSYDHVTPKQRALAVGVSMLGVFGAACAFTTLRWIGKRAHALISVNYFAVWCTIVSVVMMLALPDVGFLLPANLKEWAYLFFLGTCGFIMQFLLAAGLQYEKSSRATNMVYTQMLFALAFDKVVFGTTPGVLSILGSSLILGSAIYVAVQKETAASSSNAGPGAAGDGAEPVISLDQRADEERGLVEGMDDGDEDEDELNKSSASVAGR